MLTPEQQMAQLKEKEGVYFAAGNDDFRAARKRCSDRVAAYNSIANTANPEDRARAWLELCGKFEANDAPALVTAEAAFSDPNAVPSAPYVKAPITMDYGLRVHIHPTTFINFGCNILDTPVADIRIGSNCNLGPNVSIYSVSHPLCAGSNGKLQSSGKPVTVGNNVWVGGGATIIGGVTIGDGAVIAAGAIVTKDVPPFTLVAGCPAKFIRTITDDDKWDRPVAAQTLKEALDM